MKCQILLTGGLFACISFSAFAQFTEIRFQGSTKRYVDDPVAFFKTEATPGFQFIGSNGRLYSLDQTLAIYAAYRELPRHFDEVKINSSEKLAVVNGKFTHRMLDRKSGDTLASQVFFSYTYVKEGVDWKIDRAQHTDYIPPFREDEVALIAAIEGHAKAHFGADYATYKSFLTRTPYGSFVYRRGQFTGEELKRKLDEYWQAHKASDVKIERSNWSFRVNRVSAYVTYTQTITSAGRTIKTYETRYLEKESGKWKIVGVGVVDAG